MLPESSLKKTNEGLVVAVGEGVRDADGETIPNSVKVGEKVLLPEYGGTKLNFETDEEYILIRDSEILGKFVKVSSE